MKRYDLGLLLLIPGFCIIGCEQNEIDFYSQSPRLNFYRESSRCEFQDTDYIKKHLFLEKEVQVQLQGELLAEPRDFCFKVAEDSESELHAEVVLDEKYVYAALDTNIQVVKVMVKRPENITKSDPYTTCLMFDYTNPLHQFDPGRVDKSVFRIDVYYSIEPYNWHDSFWGSYSDAKYFFMMDCTGNIYADIPRTEESRQEIIDAYERYKEEGNPPIVDDNGLEIVFPRI